MNIWKRQHFKILLTSSLLLTLAFPPHLQCKWFDDIRDLQSLEKYCYAKARSYKARADAFNQGSWPSRQYDQLSELWTSLPTLYQTKEEDLVDEHNREVDEKVTAENEKAESEGLPPSPPHRLPDELKHWTKETVINSVADQIIQIKLHINQQKKSRPNLLKSAALTEDYHLAKSDQYKALYEATQENEALSSFYNHLSKAWGLKDAKLIGEVKLKIYQWKSQKSHHPYETQKVATPPFHLTTFAHFNRIQNRALSPLLNYRGLIYPQPLTFHVPAFDLFLWPAPLAEIQITENQYRLAGEAILPTKCSNEFFLEVKKGWFYTEKTPIPKEDIIFWKNHLFYSDYLKSTLGASTHEASLLIDQLMI